MHEVLFDDRFPEGYRRHHPRFRQGADRRGLSSDDDVFPADRARRDADRADRNREQGDTRRVRRGREVRSPRRPAPATRPASTPPRCLAPRRRLDETAAARKPVLRWRPEPATARLPRQTSSARDPERLPFEFCVTAPGIRFALLLGLPRFPTGYGRWLWERVQVYLLVSFVLTNLFFVWCSREGEKVQRDRRDHRFRGCLP